MEFSHDELEAGRKLFAVDWQFETAAATALSLPKMRGVEIAFAGRSNVGKSSLINALTSRKALARTSNTPGRTQELIFFGASKSDTSFPLTLVDMPGYGHAAASKDKIAAWTALIDDYLKGRANLARVYVLVDARHGLKEIDDHVLKALSQTAVSHQVVLTKCEAIKPSELATRIAETEAALKQKPAAYPGLIATSAREGTGIAELRAAVAKLLAERRR